MESIDSISIEILYFIILTLFFFYTSNERITVIANWTTAYRIVVDNLTARILTTNAHAWVFTFLINAGFLLATLRAEYTFGTAIWRCPIHIRQTTTNGVIIQFTTLTVYAARWGRTRCHNWRLLYYRKLEINKQVDTELEIGRQWQRGVEYREKKGKFIIPGGTWQAVNGLPI